MVKIRRFPLIFPLFFMLFACGQLHAQFYNGMQMSFGKNRVQYEDFIWSFYRFDDYDVYFYTGGREIAQYTARNMEKHLDELELLLDYQLESKLQVIIYNSYGDFKQSNIGLASSENYNVSGETMLVGSKLFVYFEGDHAELDRQIRAGIAQVLLNEMMYGGNWHEVIRNSTLLNLPAWFTQGIISYASTPWTEVENRVRDGILTGKYRKLNHLSGEHATYAGHALWHYIGITYGPPVISNILYMTRVSRNIESGFLFVLGTDMSSLINDWITYYFMRYSTLEDRKSMPEGDPVDVRTKKALTYTEPKLSPDGRYLIFAGNDMGKKKVWLYDIRRDRRKRIKKWDHRMQRVNDYTYPLLAWHPSGELFALLTVEKGQMNMYYYDMNRRKLERRPVFQLEQVNDFSFSDDGRSMIFSAVVNGQSDLYLYNIASNTQEQLTRDGFDDLQPRFIDQGRKIVFTSNRTDDTIRFENRIIQRDYNETRDIFVYDLENRSNVLRRITSSPRINERNPMAYAAEDHIVFVSDRSGINQRYLAVPDSEIAFIDTITHYRYFYNIAQLTDYPRGIIEQEVNRDGSYVESFYRDNRYRFYTGKIAADGGDADFIENYDVPLADQIPVNRNPPRVPFQPPPGVERIDVFGNEPQQDDEEEEGEEQIDINNYKFSGIPGEADTATVMQKRPVPLGDTTQLTEFTFPNQRNYNVIYYPDKVTTQLDFGFLNQMYQPFMGGYFNPGVSGMFRLSISDVFEDHRISGVIHPSLNLSNSQYLLSYEDRKQRLDKQYLFNRQTMAANARDFPFRIISNEGRYMLRWPFSEVASVRGTVAARYDKYVALGANEPALREPMIHEVWGILKAEYIYDNTLDLALNIMQGTRLKLFAEYYRLVTDLENNMAVVGADVRHYTKIHRNLIWANRIAGSTSFGSNKLLYFMGGVDSWISPRFNTQTNIDFSQNFAYQALATNMRGFEQNARNGKSFAVINSEIRFPVFNYLMNRPLRSDFLNNFQIVGFGDIGSAWNGATPYSEENTFNTNVITTNNLVIVVNTQKEPIIAGYGFGLRSRIWGYFVRADWSWGVEDYEVRPRIFYLSLSLDF